MDHPKWNHPIDIRTARWLTAGPIVKIELKYHTPLDHKSCREWLLLTRSDGSTKAVSLKFFEDAIYLRFEPGYKSLVKLTPSGMDMANDIHTIDAWEEINAAERAEYERLKAKFG